jgi:hypothetical protein
MIEKLHQNINSSTAKTLKAYGESRSEAHSCSLEACNRHFNVFVCFLLEVFVETSKRKRRTKQIYSSKYTHKLKQKRKGEAISENLNECKL